MSVQILCTLGPSSLNQRSIRRLTDIGVNMFRINLSHTRLEDVGSVIQTIRSHTDVPICLDTEGAQVRNTFMKGGRALFDEGSDVRIHVDGGEGDASQFSLNHDFVLPQLHEGDLLSIDFDTALLQVTSLRPNEAIARVLCGGWVGSNKAVYVDRPIELPCLTPKDRRALAIGRDEKLKHVALSFANRPADIAELRSLTGPDWFVISKIESQGGLTHLEDIAKASEAILIDRGDLSNEESLAKIPFLQKHIIRTCSGLSRPVYVATNLLESMLHNSRPTRAEVNDAINTLMDGASGLVLAAETAIGKHPIASAHLISRLIALFKEFRETPAHILQRENLADLLTTPLGGLLVQQIAPRPSTATGFECVVSSAALEQAELLALGAFSPLRGFPPFSSQSPLPLSLELDSRQASALKPGVSFGLKADAGGPCYSTLRIDLIEADSQTGRWRLSGQITLHQRRRMLAEWDRLTPTPRQTRLICERRGWTKILAIPHPASAVSSFAVRIAALPALLETHFADGAVLFVECNSATEARNCEQQLHHARLGSRALLHLRVQPAFSFWDSPLAGAIAARNHGCSHLAITEDQATHWPEDEILKFAGLPTLRFVGSNAPAAAR